MELGYLLKSVCVSDLISIDFWVLDSVPLTYLFILDIGVLLSFFPSRHVSLSPPENSLK